MRVSLICPIYNERESVSYLIESMLNQSKKPDEIIFVDSLSSDGTSDIIKEYAKKNKEIRLIQRKSNISEARNIAINNARHDIIAATDASSKLDKNWLRNIIAPFKDSSVDVVSGGYKAISRGGIEDYIAMITVKPMSEWAEKTFLPSGRSIAFRKKAWKAVGGYPEHLYTGEDTLFDLKLKEKGFKFKLQKKAFVYWRGRNTIRKFMKQFWLYGKGDGKAYNIRKMGMNLMFFIGMSFWMFILLASLVLKPWIALILTIPILIYLILNGVKYSIQKRRLGCLFWIPVLLLIKRFSYFFGVWRGLFK